MTSRSQNQPNPIDYDVHGLAGVRLMDALPADAAAVDRQLGPFRSTLSREPDLVIRFVDRLHTTSTTRTLGLEEAGFAGDAFFLLRPGHPAKLRVQVPFEEIGGQSAIVAEHGLQIVPLLVPILNLVLLAKGIVPLHASAFTYNGAGVLATGWAKGGKTETLLAFMDHGARYVGDEWVYLGPGGAQMYGIPLPITLWDWHLAQLPQARARAALSTRSRVAIASLLARSADWVGSSGLGRLPLLGRLAAWLHPVFHEQSKLSLSPQALFGERVGPLVTRPDKVFFVASHVSPEVRVEAVDPEWVVQRMVYSLQYERLHFISNYLKFRFAFPARANSLIEQTEALEREALSGALAGKETLAVWHPYPLSFPALFEALSPFLD